MCLVDTITNSNYVLFYDTLLKDICRRIMKLAKDRHLVTLIASFEILTETRLRESVVLGRLYDRVSGSGLFEKCTSVETSGTSYTVTESYSRRTDT
jgi:hypothetical protein